MEKALQTMIESIKESIINDAKVGRENKSYHTLMLVLAAYNDFQESQKDGVDYIFDLDNTKDVICCLEGGMTTRQLAVLYEEHLYNTTPYFFFGQNYSEPTLICNFRSLRLILLSALDDVLRDVLAYPYAHDSYKELYATYVTYKIVK